MPSTQLNLRPIENLLQQIAGIRHSGQSELRIGKQHCQDLEHCLAVLLTHIASCQEEIIRLQQEKLADNVIDVRFDAGDFK
jgi:hypothetical protein